MKSIALFFFLLLGCNPFADKRPEDKYPQKDQFGLIATPRVFPKNATVSFTMPQNHPEELAILGPDQTWFYIFPGTKQTRTVSQREFKHAKVWTVKINELKGQVYTNGKADIKQVFTIPGEYLIYLAESMETEPANTLSFETTVYLK